MKIKLFISIIVLFAFISVPVNSDINGDIITAECECGFKNTMMLGGGKLNFETVFLFPYYCTECSEMKVLNALSESHCCDKCNSGNVIPYDDESLRLHFSNNVVFSRSVDTVIHILYDDFYFCPKCKEFKMKFTQTGNWD